MAGVARPAEMINERRPVLDAWLCTSDQMREIVVLLDMPARLGEDAAQPAAKGAVADALDLAFELDPAVPDFQRRQLGEVAHVTAVGADRASGNWARPLVRKLGRQGSDRRGCRRPLETA